MKRVLTHFFAVATIIALASACCNSPKGTTLTGKVLCDNKPVAGVAVTDGEQIVTTNDKGIYNITSTKPYGVVYITTPSGYEPAMMDAVRPNFWARTTADATTKERHDFNLKKIDDESFSILMFTDTHFCNDPKREDTKHFKELASPAIARAAADTKHNIFSVCLGDITWDRFWYATGLSIECVPQHLTDNQFPMPFYCVHGNHDYDPSVPATENPNTNAIQRFSNTFGPTFYSMNRGGVHFVMLDNIVYKNEVKENQKTAVGVVGSRNYDLYVDDAQLDWLAKDLALVDKSTPLVLCMHAPLFTYNGKGEQVYSFIDGKSELLVNMIKDFKDVKIFSGHSHRTMSFIHPEYPNIVEYNITSIGGDLWNTPSKFGINIGEDGADAGFWLCTFNNGDFSKRWYSVNGGSEVPFRAYDMNEVAKSYKNSKELKHLCKLQRNQMDYSQPKYKNYIYINCWAWEQGCTLTVTENGKTLNVEKVTDSDPLAAKVVFAKPSILKAKKESSKTNRLAIAANMFRAKGATATADIVITLTTPNGEQYTQTLSRPTPLLVQ